MKWVKVNEALGSRCGPSKQEQELQLLMISSSNLVHLSIIVVMLLSRLLRTEKTEPSVCLEEWAAQSIIIGAANPCSTKEYYNS